MRPISIYICPVLEECPIDVTEAVTINPRALEGTPGAKSHK
jgi:hypothetical protein